MERLLKVIPFVPFIVLVISFWEELTLFPRWFIRWFLLDQKGPPEDFAALLPVLVIVVLSFLIFFLFWLRMVSYQAIFPVTELSQGVATAIYLLLHLISLHGVAAYVRNGRIKAYVEELDIRRPGTVVVDFNSAIAVEHMVLPRSLRRTMTDLARGLMSFVGIRLPAIRIRSAGLTFLLPDERIYGVNDLFTHPVMTEDHSWMERILGVVDLRNQFRTSGGRPHPLSKRLGAPILAYTRDGIEVKTSLWVQATIGQDLLPYFPLAVAYIGDQQPQNLRVVKIQVLTGQPDKCRVESLADDLDEADRFEIHQQWQTVQNWGPYHAPPSPDLLPQFDEDRVFAAVYGRARHHRGLGGADEIVPWVDLPIHMSVDFFREIISQYNYDEIYKPRPDGSIGLRDIRSRLGSEMRNSGLLAFQPVFHKAHPALEPECDYLLSDLLTVPANHAFLLRNPKVLRDRGIRVIGAGFGDLVVDEAIYRQRLDHWRAAWDQETEIVEAELEFDSAKNRTRARILAQQEFVECLSQIYQTGANSKEILALRVLQALEVAATDPKTRQLLPEDTFSMLRSIHDWMLPQDMGYGST
ncbi:MAG TPA: hypothetical protein VK900_01430 [Anaerolineales bacterium]|nr:hypothetical protein [Anaerolineales bacterium]